LSRFFLTLRKKKRKRRLFIVVNSCKGALLYIQMKKGVGPSDEVHAPTHTVGLSRKTFGGVEE